MWVVLLSKEDSMMFEARTEGIEQFLVNVLIYDAKNMLAFIKSDNYRESLGGHIKPYESVFSGGKREAKEESGLEVKIDRYLGHKDFSLNGKLTRMFFLKGDVGFELTPVNLKKRIVLSEEHKGYLLIPLQNLNLYKFKHEQKSFLAEYFTRIKHRNYIRNKKGLKLVA